MQFNSYIFIFVLPLFLVGYFGAHKIGPICGKIFLIIASACFYFYAGWQVACLLGFSVLVNYSMAQLISKYTKKHC